MDGGRRGVRFVEGTECRGGEVIGGFDRMG